MIHAATGTFRWYDLLGAATGCLIVACQVDNRQLAGVTWPGTGSTSSSTGGRKCNNSGNMDSGTNGGASSTSTACSPGGSPSAICPDLNNDNVPDDTQSLVTNSTFDLDTDGWNFELGVGFGPNNDDACRRSDSGSISVTNQFAGTSGSAALVGVTQCLGVSSGAIYSLTANVTPSEGYFGGVGLAYYVSADCDASKDHPGPPEKQFNSTRVESNNAWQVAVTSGVSPNDAQSVAVRLFVGAPAPPEAGNYANGLFDNILVLKL